MGYSTADKRNLTMHHNDIAMTTTITAGFARQPHDRRYFNIGLHCMAPMTREAYRDLSDEAFTNTLTARAVIDDFGNLYPIEAFR